MPRCVALTPYNSYYSYYSYKPYNSYSSHKPMPQQPDFIAYANTCIARMQGQGRYDAAHKLGVYLGRFVSYLGRGEMPFADIDAALMQGYQAWLAERKLGRNSVALFVRSLKRIYGMAVAEGVATDARPFEGLDVSYRVKMAKPRMAARDILRLRYLDLSGRHQSVAFARDLFLFSVLAHGMTAYEAFHLTEDNIKGGCLAYTRRATAEQVTVSWLPFMQQTVDRYARPATPYLFPVITARDPLADWHQHNVALHNVNRNLKTLGRLLGLSFPLTMTVAQHSWQEAAAGLTLGSLV